MVRHWLSVHFSCMFVLVSHTLLYLCIDMFERLSIPSLCCCSVVMETLDVSSFPNVSQYFSRAIQTNVL